MTYRHSFRVRAPLERVAAFHRRAASMAALTPPPVIVQMNRTPPLLASGDEMAFTLWLGPLPVRWLALIETVTPGGFTDRQIRGPFAAWVHHHRFTALDEHTTQVDDEIDLQLSRRPFWLLVGLSMQLSLPLLFAFRSWKTRRLLQN